MEKFNLFNTSKEYVADRIRTAMQVLNKDTYIYIYFPEDGFAGLEFNFENRGGYVAKIEFQEEGIKLINCLWQYNCHEDTVEEFSEELLLFMDNFR